MEEVRLKDFNRSGLTHFIAISGTHMVIIFGLILYGFRSFIFPNNRKLSVVFSLILIWCFAAYIGFGNSVVRSCIMISAYYIFVILQRKTDMLHSLSLAALLMLFVDSQQLFEVGFQLSFVAVLGIYWLNKPILKYLPKPKNTFQKILVNTCSISLSAQIATLPLSIYYFHQFSWMSIPANLIIVPLSEVVILFSFLMVILFKLNLELTWILKIYQFFTDGLLSLIHWFANQDFAFHTLIPMTLVEVLCLFVVVYFLRAMLKKWSIQTVIPVMVLMICFLALRWGLNEFNLNKNEVIVVQNFKNKVIIDKNREKIKVYVAPKSDTIPIKKFIIDPYLISRRAIQYQMVNAPGTEVLVNGTYINMTSR